MLFQERSNEFVEFIESRAKDLTWFRALLRTDYTCGLELIHDTASLCVTDAQTALQIGGRTFLVHDHHLCGIFEERIDTGHIDGTWSRITIRSFRHRQVVRCRETLMVAVLAADVFRDLVDLIHADQCTLDTFHLDSGIVEHITLTDQVLRSVGIQNSHGVSTGNDTEGDSGREVRLDQTGYDIDGRTLCRDDDMDT